MGAAAQPEDKPSEQGDCTECHQHKEHSIERCQKLRLEGFKLDVVIMLGSCQSQCSVLQKHIDARQESANCHHRGRNSMKSGLGESRIGFFTDIGKPELAEG